MARILLLEPDLMLADSLAFYLKTAGHVVAIHSDPQAAVQAADRHRPDAVISELQLAGRSGAEFLYEFRSYPDWQDLPVIIYTNLYPEQVGAYSAVLTELGVGVCLYKSQTGLAGVADQLRLLLSLRAA